MVGTLRVAGCFSLVCLLLWPLLAGVWFGLGLRFGGGVGLGV